jgi:hypothetical protein
MGNNQHKVRTLVRTLILAAFAMGVSACEIPGMTGSKKGPSKPVFNLPPPQEGGIKLTDPDANSGPRTYWVSGSGNDAHAGYTRVSAFKTLAKAMTVARAGDVVMLASGTYRESLNCVADVRVESADGDGNAVISQFTPTSHTVDVIDAGLGTLRLVPPGGFSYDIGMRRLYFVHQNQNSAIRLFLATHGKASIEDAHRYPLNTFSLASTLSYTTSHSEGAIAQSGDFVEFTSSALAAQGVITSVVGGQFTTSLLSAPSAQPTHFMLMGERFISQAREFAPLTASGQIKLQVAPTDYDLIRLGTLKASRMTVDSLFGSTSSCQNTSLVGLKLVGDEISVPGGVTLIRSTLVDADGN